MLGKKDQQRNKVSKISKHVLSHRVNLSQRFLETAVGDQLERFLIAASFSADWISGVSS